ncbi:MAG TPA: histidinol-phosphate transaminase, partial [Gemmatimonadaceae bacterium]|nr:histidinol-phosphate transaminase [Gemmatimonadaceae bacterium]
MIVPRAEVLETELAVHGGRRGLHEATTAVRYDFSVCLNAFGPADVVRRAVERAAIDEYPDPECRAPRESASARWFTPVSDIAFGAGAAELIHAVCQAYLSPGEAAIIVSPSFGEYERAVRLRGARAIPAWCSPDGTEQDIGSMCAVVEQAGPRIVTLCAPTTPAGGAVSQHCIRRLADTCERAGALLVVDQAYDAFAEAPIGMPALPRHPAVLHLRSLTKEHALAGLRVAFAVGPAHVIDALNRVRVPWSASSVAQAAGVAALSDEAAQHVERTVNVLRREAARLQQSCAAFGFVPRPSTTHYFVVDVGNGAAVTRILLDRAGIAVRDCTSFGLPECIRVAARTVPEND